MTSAAKVRGVSRFTLVHDALWMDPDFLDLSTGARLLFIWTWTNPKAAICGLYEVSLKQMSRAFSEEFGVAPLARVGVCLDELAAKPMVKYDAENEVLWVVERAKHANRSPKVAIKMQKEVEACPSSPLVTEFIEKYGAMLRLRLQED